MGCAMSKPKTDDKELVTIEDLQKEFLRFKRNIRGYWRRKKAFCLRKGRPVDRSGFRGPANEEKNSQNKEIKQDAHQNISDVVARSQRDVGQIQENQGTRYDPNEKYYFIKKIGAGGFGQVYVAKHKIQGRKYAIKAIELGNSDFESLKMEVEILRSCKHKNILALYESYLTSTHLHLVTEYVAGASLYTISTLTWKLITENIVSFIMRECLQGLAYLHEKKYIHCDIKSDNILVGIDGQVKIADFGLAVRADQENRLGFRGTRHYVSQEMANGFEFGKEIDIWGLGIVAIEMLQGYPPLKEARIIQNYDLFSKCGYSSMSRTAAAKTSTVFQDFLKGALRYRPSERWSARELLKHPFIMSPSHFFDNYGCLERLLGYVILNRGV